MGRKNSELIAVRDDELGVELSTSQPRRDVSVVIVNWNTRDELSDCLTSVLASDAIVPEIIVVDNASCDGSVAVVQGEFPLVRIIRNEKNLGFARASNQGIEASRGRYVLLLNPDCIVYPGAFSQIVQFGDANPDVGIFGVRILNPDGSVFESCRRFPTLAAGVFRNAILARLFPNNPYTREYLMADWNHDTAREVDWVSGAALVMRRELLEDIGRLDERFFMYCEDVDIAYRAKERNWRVMYYPDAAVMHLRARSSDQNPVPMIVAFHRSMYAFFDKHYAERSSLVTRAIVPLGLVFRTVLLIAHNRVFRLLKRRGS